MRHGVCDGCGQSYPLNSLYQVFGQSHCEPCGNSAIAARGAKLSPGDVSKLVDPTGCGWCSTDYGRQELVPIGNVPACETCEQRMRNWPYPTRIKASFVVLLLLAVGAFAYNFRFFKAYVHMLRGNHTTSFEEGRDHALAAAALVPESQPLQDQADLFRAIEFMQQDNSAEALALLTRLQSRNHDPRLASLIIEVEMGAAFDRKDYDTFLAKARDKAEHTPEDIMAKASVASALACQYAATGEEGFAREASDTLTEAQSVAGTDTAEFANYEDRIRFRLATRQIVNSAEFERRFPKGWHGQQDEP